MLWDGAPLLYVFLRRAASPAPRALQERLKAEQGLSFIAHLEDDQLICETGSKKPSRFPRAASSIANVAELRTRAMGRPSEILARLALETLDATEPAEVSVLDLAAGTGGFLVAAFQEIAGAAWHRSGRRPTGKRLDKMLQTQLVGGRDGFPPELKRAVGLLDASVSTSWRRVKPRKFDIVRTTPEIGWGMAAPGAVVAMEIESKAFATAQNCAQLLHGLDALTVLLRPGATLVVGRARPPAPS